MADHPLSNKTLFYRHEILKARLEIHEYFLNESIKEIYDNIAQSLSLIRVRLALLKLKNSEEVTGKASGDLISVIIKDLRTVCQWLSSEAYLGEVVRSLVNKMYPGTDCLVYGHFDSTSTIRNDKVVILVYLTLEIMKLLSHQKASLIEVCVDCKGGFAKIQFTCNDQPFLSEQSNRIRYSDLAKKTTSFGGRMKIKRAEQKKIKINLVMLIV